MYNLQQESKTINAIKRFFNKHKKKKLDKIFNKIDKKNWMDSGADPSMRSYYSFNPVFDLWRK